MELKALLSAQAAPPLYLANPFNGIERELQVPGHGVC